MKPDIWHDPLFLAGLKGGGQGGSASGPIVTFAGDGSPLRSLRLSIDPVQDLHGYDSPWPEGGGKNLIPTTLELLKARNTGGTWSNNVYSISGMTFTVNDNGTITVNGTSSEAIYFNFIKVNEGVTMSAGSYVLHATGNANINVTAAKNGGYWGNAITSNTVLTLDADADVAFYSYVASGKTLTNFVLSPMFESGSTASAWQPYSNICPISGWSEVNAWRTGKNLLANAQIEQGTITGTGYTQASDYRVRFADYIQLKAGTYKIVTKPVLYGTIRVYSSQSANSYISGESVATWALLDGYTFTLTEDRYIKLTMTRDAVNNVPISPVDVDLTSASEALDTYPITIPTEAGTVYGGEWDVIGGVLKKTWGMAILANRTWAMETTANGNVFSCNLLPDKAKSYNQMCSKYKTVETYRSYLKNGEMGTYNATNGRNRVSICDNTYSTVSDFVNGLAGVNYIYELATPITIPLTPQEISTLAGQNVMWADCGDIAVEWAGGKGFGKDAMLAWVMHR